MMKYTKEEIINKLKGIKEISEIYNSSIINYRGKTKDTDEKYTEIISKEIIDNYQIYNFDNINCINRKQKYKITTHDGEFSKESNRREEITAMKMFNNDYAELGKILDYQIPLKDKRNSNAGKIDLISYNERNNILYLIELKNDSSVETLLRCVLEIVTYSKQINKQKLITDFNLKNNVNIKLAILIFKGTNPYKDIKDEYVNKLIEKFNIDIFIAEFDKSFKIKKVTH